MRRGAITGLALLLAACTSQGFNPILVAAVHEANPFEKPKAPPQAPVVSRAAVDKADVAMIEARLAGDKIPTYLVAASNNGGYISYASSLRQIIIMRGSEVTTTHGLGWALLGVTSSQPDPIMFAAPPGRWPKGVRRSYQFPADGPQGKTLAFECSFAFGARTDVVILQQRHHGVAVTETCVGPDITFVNKHVADVETGYVWRTQQWLGPQQGFVDIDVVLPYTGNPR